VASLVVERLRQLAEGPALRALEELLDGDSGAPPSVRLAAAREVIDRALGKGSARESAGGEVAALEILISRPPEAVGG
jgi:hypothetical protein